MLSSKPFRDPSRPSFTGHTDADKLMINGLASQVLNYGLAVVCLREAAALGRLSQGTERFATSSAIVLFLLQVPQAVQMVCGGGDDNEKGTGKADSRDKGKGKARKGVSMLGPQNKIAKQHMLDTNLY